MNFKNKLFSKAPYLYISMKADREQAKLIYEGYREIKNQSLFDEDFYLENYPDTAAMDPLLHYLFFGFEEGKKPNREFDAAYYLSKYDVDINPLIHYALIGNRKGYSFKLKNRDLNEFKDSSKKSILFVLHEKINNLGGTGFTGLDIIKSLDERYQKFILTSSDQDVELWEYGSKLRKLAHWNVEYSNFYSAMKSNRKYKFVFNDFEKNLFNSDLRDIYSEVLSKLDIDIIHFNHSINHSLDIFNLAREKDIEYVMSIHDFYYCCPSIHLLDRNSNFCNLDCCENCIMDNDDGRLADMVELWQKHCSDILSGAHTTIFPSESSLKIYKEFYPQLNNFKVISHGRNIEKINIPTSFPENKIKILFPGLISPHKGSLLIDSIKELDSKNRLEFHFMGVTIPQLKCGINHGRYEREDFGKIVNEIRPNYIGLMSVCPETYSHTLTESIGAGIPIIATDLGAQKERVEENDIGWIVNHENPEEAYNTIINISKEDYDNKVRNISNVKLKTFDEMIREYDEIYEEIT